jgi:hypothetical protein
MIPFTDPAALAGDGAAKAGRTGAGFREVVFSEEARGAGVEDLLLSPSPCAAGANKLASPAGFAISPIPHVSAARIRTFRK